MEKYIDKIVAIVVVLLLAAALIPSAVNQIMNVTFSDAMLAAVWNVIPIFAVVAILFMIIRFLKE